MLFEVHILIEFGVRVTVERRRENDGQALRRRRLELG